MKVEHEVGRRVPLALSRCVESLDIAAEFLLRFGEGLGAVFMGQAATLEVVGQHIGGTQAHGPVVFGARGIQVGGIGRGGFGQFRAGLIGQNISEQREEPGPVDGGEVIMLLRAPLIVHEFQRLGILRVLEQAGHGRAGKIFPRIATRKIAAPPFGEVVPGHFGDKACAPCGEAFGIGIGCRIGYRGLQGRKWLGWSCEKRSGSEERHEGNESKAASFHGSVKVGLSSCLSKPTSIVRFGASAVG